MTDHSTARALVASCRAFALQCQPYGVAGLLNEAADFIEQTLTKKGLKIVRAKPVVFEPDEAHSTARALPDGSLTLDNASVQRLMDYGLLHYTNQGWMVGKWEDAVRADTAPPEGDTVSGEVVELIKQLQAPKQWCCIFEHEGQMRHGTTDAPFKAAAALQSRVSPQAGMIEEQGSSGERKIELDEMPVVHPYAIVHYRREGDNWRVTSIEQTETDPEATPEGDPRARMREALEEAQEALMRADDGLCRLAASDDEETRIALSNYVRPALTKIDAALASLSRPIPQEGVTDAMFAAAAKAVGCPLNGKVGPRNREFFAQIYTAMTAARFKETPNGN